MNTLRRTQQTNAARSRGGLRRQITRILVGLIVLPMILGPIGLVCESSVESRLCQRCPPPGTRIDVGMYDLHLYCTGEYLATHIERCIFDSTIVSAFIGAAGGS